MYASHTQHYNLTLYYTLLCLTTKCLASIHHHTIDPLLPLPLYISPSTSPGITNLFFIFMFLFLFLFIYSSLLFPLERKIHKYLSLTSFTWRISSRSIRTVTVARFNPFMAKQYCIVYLYSKSLYSQTSS